MKITDPHVIEDGEKDLIDAVQQDLDIDAVKQILKNRLTAAALASRGGQIVVHNNKIAFRLDFDINLSGSLLFDRQGNYIDESGEAPLLEPEMAQDTFDVDTPAHDRLAAPLPDEIPLVETGLDETDLAQEDLEEEFSITLPEYDLEDEMEPADREDTNTEPLNLEAEDLLPQESDRQIKNEEDFQILENDSLENDSLESDSLEIDGLEIDGLENETLENETLENETLENETLEDETLEDDTGFEDEMLDDDINDILKESRDFWEHKKDS